MNGCFWCGREDDEDKIPCDNCLRLAQTHCIFFMITKQKSGAFTGKTQTVLRENVQLMLRGLSAVARYSLKQSLKTGFLMISKEVADEWGLTRLLCDPPNNSRGVSL